MSMVTNLRGARVQRTQTRIKEGWSYNKIFFGSVHLTASANTQLEKK